MKKLLLGLSFAVLLFAGCTQVTAPAETLEEQAIVYDWRDTSRNRGPIDGDGFLSNVRWAGARNSLGPVERNMTNGGRAAKDGSPFPNSYTEGLGVWGNSVITYLLPGTCYILTTEPGNLDTSASPDARILFRIYADGQLIHERDSAQLFALRREINISGVRKLVFITRDLNPAAANKSANWLNSSIACN
jgi:alpha-galactosidase